MSAMPMQLTNSDPVEMDIVGLLTEIKGQFKLDWHGIHGFRHWLRVRHHGMTLTSKGNGNQNLIELFAFLHDSRRLDEDDDPDHGVRAADYAATLNGKYFKLVSDDLKILCHAINFHSDGLTHKNPTVQSCWDADRLDLGRVGIVPRAKYLSQKAGLLIDNAQSLMKMRIEDTNIVPSHLADFLMR